MKIQLVEHAAVNRRVVGSSPTVGANKQRVPFGTLCFLIFDIGLEPTTSTPISAKHQIKIFQTFDEIGRNSPADCFVVRRANF